MIKRKLGKTDIEITPIGLGVWQFSEAKGFHKFFWKGIEKEETKNIVDITIKSGVNWFDTAEIYGSGRSEMGLSRALEELNVKEEDIFIATKWNPIFRTAKSIEKTFHKRVENLSPYPITLHQVHNSASFSSAEKEMKAMANLLDTGKVKAVGVSNFSSSAMIKSNNTLEERGHSLASNQVRYSLLDRRIEKNGVLDTAKELGTTIIAYSPLEQGLLTGKFHDNPDLLNNTPFIRKRILKRKYEKSRVLIDLLKSIADNHEVAHSQVALNWLINYHGETVVAIPGASRSKHAELNAGTLNFELSREEMDVIDEKSTSFI